MTDTILLWLTCPNHPLDQRALLGWAEPQSTAAGTCIFPVPRITLARPFISQSRALPAKTILE
jgi:hypothetical protein